MFLERKEENYFNCPQESPSWPMRGWWLHSTLPLLAKVFMLRELIEVLPFGLTLKRHGSDVECAKEEKCQKVNVYIG